MEPRVVAVAFERELLGGGRKAAPELATLWKKVYTRVNPDAVIAATTNWQAVLKVYSAEKRKQSFLDSPVLIGRFRALGAKLERRAQTWPGIEDEGNASLIGLAIHFSGSALYWSVQEKRFLLSAEQTTKRFYEALQVQDFARAWDLLHPTFQQWRWLSSRRRFESGFRYLQAVGSIFVRKVSGDSVKAKVDATFDEERLIPAWSILHEIRSLSVESAKKVLVEHLETLASQVRSFGGNDQAFNDLPLSILLRTDSADVLPFELQLDPAGPMKHFRSAPPLKITRAVRVHLLRERDEWKITRIGIHN
jgi:hypothetical protein